MANYKKYAENLIGNWNKDIYEPQKGVTKDIYQTNWNKLSNDYNALKDKLARNFELAQMNYTNTLNNVQSDSFNRMRNANIDLANRGLSSSGMLDLITQGDIQQKGQDVDKALADLLNTNKANIEGLTEDVINLGKEQSSLASDLAGDIGKLTAADAENAQQYAGLIGGIGENAAQRAASRARSGGGSRASKIKAEADEIGRKIRIADVLESTDLSDKEKAHYLITYLDVPSQKALDAVSAYNNNVKLQANRQKIANINDKIGDLAASSANWKTNAYKYIPSQAGKFLIGDVLNYPNSRLISNQNTKKKLENEISGMTYTDLAKLLYGKK